MCLAAVVRLVVEEMVERGRQRLLDLDRPHESAVADGAGKVGVCQSSDIVADARILRGPRRPQWGEVVIEDGIEAFRQFARASEAGHPDAIADQQVIQGPVQRLEEGAAVGAVVCLGDGRGGLI
jgi:hypothetical protein